MKCITFPFYYALSGIFKLKVFNQTGLNRADMAKTANEENDKLI